MAPSPFHWAPVVLLRGPGRSFERDLRQVLSDFNPVGTFDELVHVDAFIHARLWSEKRNDPGALGSRVAAELLRQGARDIIAGIPH
ncbi:hypothetical protein [Streptomyces sp. BE133]|uniref:hypothetical protein n=1 Tax=Streptomyces sp. BE133 TaxID=3002523 RepID=UPI002E7851F2|nr:hypothetical protein [Streptomyces sp. BE133]MEE1805818.1 hypothetical protein [Streptomyces sp. BE133]